MIPSKLPFIYIVFILTVFIVPLFSQTPSQLYQRALLIENGEGDLNKSVDIYTKIVMDKTADRALRAKAQLHIGLCYEKLGLNEAQKAYQRVIDNYTEFQNEVSVAKQNLARLSRVFDETMRKPKFRKLKIPTKLSWVMQLSPDGKKVIFVSASDNKLWMMPLSGKLGPEFPGAPIILNTDEVKVDWSGLAWSGNGKWIAFNEWTQGQEWKENEGNQGIYIVPAEGGKPKKVHENYRDARILNYKISLSPDGKMLAFSSVDSNECFINTISVDGDLPRQLVNAQAREPVFSPDGKMIAYVDTKNLGKAGGGLRVIPVSSGTPKLVANAGNASSPVWSPDGDLIAFLDLDSQQICIIPVAEDGAAAGEVVKIDVPEGTGGIMSLAGWTPDNKIGAVFRSHTEFGLYTLAATGGKAALVSYGRYPAQPRWSPDGKRIFHTNEIDEGSGDWEQLSLAVVPAEGGEINIIPIHFDEKMIKPAWGGGNEVSLDGKTIVFSGQSKIDTSWHWQIWTLPVEGGKPRQLTQTAVSVLNGFPCWSPDGKSIAYVRARADKVYSTGFGEVNIYTISVNGGDPKVLTSDSDSVKFCPIAWSPDGKRIAYFSTDKDEYIAGKLKYLSVNDGISHVVGKIKLAHNNIEMAWSPDSKKIAFNYGPEKYAKDIRVISIDDGSIVDVKTGLVDINIYHLDWSSDGKRFVFSGYQGDSPEFWIMENFLHEIKAEAAIRKKEKEFNIRKIWAGSEVDIEGAPSPDGRYISYVDWETGDLAIYKIATAKKRRLTNKGSWDESDECAFISRWSPDSKQIVYEWYNGKNHCDLRIIGLDGSKSRILYSNKEVNWTHAYDWSADGKQILAYFERKKGTDWITQIVLVSTADGSVRILKNFDGSWPENMCFSPDGRYIVYDFPQKTGSPERDIFLLSSDGSRQVSLIEHPSNDELLGWAPDGKNIIFTSDRKGAVSFWILQVAEGKPQGIPKMVKSGMGSIKPLGFTRNGTFYYGNSQKRNNIYIAELDPQAGEILAPAKRIMTRFEGYNQTPEYSPDGKYLAYISRRFPLTNLPDYTVAQIGGNVLCIRSLETGQEREIFPDLDRFSFPRWSPDGNFIIVMDFNQNGYYQIDTQTGKVTPVLKSDNNISLNPPERSPDGKTIFYVRCDKKTNIYRIFVRDLASGTENEIYRSDDLINISLSPDGQWLALLANFFMSEKKPVLNVIPSARGESRELYRFEEGIDFIEAGAPITWTADGKYILYAMKPSQKDDSKGELYRIPVEGGTPERLGLEMTGWIINLSAHPDGRHIAISSSEQSAAEIWVMENFLPQ